MSHFLYWPEDASFLARRKLREFPEGARVHLVTPRASVRPETPENCANAVAGILTLGAAADCARLEELLRAENSAPEIFLPFSPDMRTLRFRPGLLNPDITPYYPEIAALWRVGFRRFTCSHLAGERTFAIPHLLDELHNRHAGQRCFVVGNGPSLNDIDMTRLRGEIALGSNQCYLGFESWGVRFPYWGVYDEYQIQEYGPDYERNVPADCMQCFPFAYLPFLDFPNACPLNIDWPRDAPRQFSDQPDRVFRGFTVTYMLLQVAAVMGCDPVILIGTDHRYRLTRRYIPSKTLRRARRAITRRLRDGALYAAADAALQAWRKQRRDRAEAKAVFWEAGHAAGPTHFTSTYSDPAKRRFLPPEPEEAERDFACAAAWARERGVRILNATPGSALRAFPMTDFDALF